VGHFFIVHSLPEDKILDVLSSCPSTTCGTLFYCSCTPHKWGASNYVVVNCFFFFVIFFFFFFFMCWLVAFH